MTTEIGKVLHYFPNINVAVLHLSSGNLKIGDRVKLLDRAEKEFIQEVKSMQIEHAQIDIAKAGDEFGLLVEKEPKVNSKVCK